MSAPGDRLAGLLRPVLAGTGADLEGLTVSPAGRRRVVRVVVDKDGGITLDDVAELSRLLSDALDDVDAREPALLGGAYVLEVSSPGVDRPLTEPRHWRRSTGRLVAVALHDGSSVTGRVLRVDGDAVVLDVEGVERVLPPAQVARGLVQVEFGRPQPGQAASDEAADDDAVPGDETDDETDDATDDATDDETDDEDDDATDEDSDGDAPDEEEAR